MTNIEMENIAREFRELQSQIKTLEEMSDALRQQMIKEMDARNIEGLDAGGRTIRWTIYESSRLDTAKLRVEHPDLYSQYSKATTSTRFSVA